MSTETRELAVHPAGEQPEVGPWSAMAGTFAGRLHVEWGATAPVTPFGQMPFFIDCLKQAGRFDAWVADCPLWLTSPNASVIVSSADETEAVSDESGLKITLPPRSAARRRV